MRYSVANKLSTYKGSYNQQFGHDFHSEADSKCPGDTIQLFDPADINLLVATCCSECDDEREE